MSRVACEKERKLRVRMAESTHAAVLTLRRGSARQRERHDMKVS